MPSNKPSQSPKAAQSLAYYSKQGKRFVAAILLSASIAANASSQSYNIRDLGTLGGTIGRPIEVNKSGEVVGISTHTSGEFPPRPFLYANDEMIDLGTLDNGTYGYATGINDRTQVVGASSTSSGGLRAFLWEDGEMIDLNTLLNSNSSFVYDINNSGQIIGHADNVGAFRYDPDGTLTPLGSLGGHATPLAINEGGEIVGHSEISPDGPHRAFLYRGGKMTALETSRGGFLDIPNDINDEGQIVGYSRTETIYEHGFLYTNGRVTDLETPDGRSSRAFGINNAGLIVGTLSFGTAVIWENGIMKKLIDLVPENSGWEYLNEAKDINEAGQIVGYGRLCDDGPFFKRVFLLTPVDPCADDDGDGRVMICHVPPGNPDNAHTMSVSVNAVPAHLGHGDECGPCEDPPECQTAADCDDGDKCTDEVCGAGQCFFGLTPCFVGYSCDPATGRCEPLDCESAEDCNDLDACTADDCLKFRCSFSSKCKPDEICTNGVCLLPCDEHSDCEDNNACTTDLCGPKHICVYGQTGCPMGETCNPETGMCEPAPSTSCPSRLFHTACRQRTYDLTPSEREVCFRG